jgi:Helicase HerA, central domain
MSVPVYASAFDYLGKRTALFGMTRTGKSNTVKMIIQATVELAASGAKLDSESVRRIGQIIFDVSRPVCSPISAPTRVIRPATH